ncbi:MAG: hypothetical protein AAGU27_12635 [Dehalobacterium sp.]
MEVCIHSGICGFQTKVNAETDGEYQTKLQFVTDCPNVKKMAAALDTVNVMNELFRKGQSEIMAAAQQHLPHITCPVPIGALKVLEASAGMALIKDVSITFTK